MHLLLSGNSQQIPNVMAANNSRVKRVDPTNVPPVEEAIIFYENAGGKLTRECCFVIDPLQGNVEAIRRRESKFRMENPSFDIIFDHLVSAGDGSVFETAVLSFIQITTSLTQHV